MAGPGSLRLVPSSTDLRRLSLDLGQIVLDIAGVADPTPISDGLGAILSLARGDFVGAGLSALGIVPYVGDLAKAGKFPRYLKTLESVVKAASESADAARLLAPIVQRLDDALELLPKNAGREVERMRKLVDDFLQTSHTPRRRRLSPPDVRNQFRYKVTKVDGKVYKDAWGRLGVPKRVREHRNPTAQKSLSSQMGEDAGHLIGNRFGASGELENLTLQNWRTNRYGSYKDLENDWANKLQNGTGIEVFVRDITPAGAGRPSGRIVKWREIRPDGTTLDRELRFINPHTARSRSAQGVAPTVSEPQSNNVFDFFTGERVE